MNEITLLAYAGAACLIFIWAIHHARPSSADRPADRLAAEFKLVLAVVCLLLLFYGIRCYTVWSGQVSVLRGWFGPALPAVVVLVVWWLERQDTESK